MKHSIDYYKPLNLYFNLPSEFMTLHISSLKTVANKDGSKPAVNRVINGLRRTGCTTLGEVLKLTWEELRRIRSFGIVSEDLLFELFERIIKDPSSFIERNKSEIIKIRMRERGYIK